MTRSSFTFVDLFAGIGGFHAALAGLGGECVYAVEIDPDAAAIYEMNWGFNPLGDITEDANEDSVKVPPHDVLVAGFPCQPFSKSGLQRGMEETRGTLYWNILRIIEVRKPKLVLLENVRNLAGPRHKHEWEVIIKTLREQGYRVSDKPTVMSPHWIPKEKGGRPQARERVFIAATLADDSASLTAEPVLSKNSFPEWNHKNWILARDLPLQKKLINPALDLDETETHWINAWDDFVRGLLKKNGTRLPGFPLWADSWQHAGQIDGSLPDWKIEFLEKNHDFYFKNKKFIDKWADKWDVYSDLFPPSRRKLEWQAQDIPTLWETILHFRPSGIRAKAPNYVPALVAITQTSVVGSLKRRLSVREAAVLQGFPEWFSFGNQSDARSYRQLGNGVCIGVVWQVLKAHASRDRDILEKTAPRLLKAIEHGPENPDSAIALLAGSHE